MAVACLTEACLAGEESLFQQAASRLAAMWKMLNHDVHEDFIIATGDSHNLQNFVEAVFDEAGLNWQEYVITDPNLFRP